MGSGSGVGGFGSGVGRFGSGPGQMGWVGPLDGLWVGLLNV